MDNTTTVDPPAYHRHSLENSLLYDEATGTLSRLDGQTHLPSQPWMSLNSDELIPQLRKAHEVSNTDVLRRFLVVNALTQNLTTQPLSPLHVQSTISGYTLKTATHPDLHLTYTSDPKQLYIQPLPAYFLSTAFWEWLRAMTTVEDQNFTSGVKPTLYASARGFMRSYVALIRSETDFKMAVSPEAGLIPTQTSDGTAITFENFVEFLKDMKFDQVQDSDVSQRWRYGTLMISNAGKIPELYRYGFVVADPWAVPWIRFVQFGVFVGWVVSQCYIYRGVGKNEVGVGVGRFFISIAVLLAAWGICSIVKSEVRKAARKRLGVNVEPNKEEAKDVDVEKGTDQAA